MTDPFAEFKARQREAWSLFAPLEAVTTMPAADLVRFAAVEPGQRVEALTEKDPAKLAAFRVDLEGLIGESFADNAVRHDYLMSRATKL